MKPAYDFEIYLRYPPRQNFPGEWTGVHKDSGYEFWQLREYQPGDNISLIDWKAKARTGRLHVREFLRDTFYNLVLFCDISPSMHFGAKFQLLREIAASLAHASLKDGNACGLVLFSEKVVRTVAPSSIPRQYSVICNALENAAGSKAGHTSFRSAVEYLTAANEPSLNVFISDFLYDVSAIKDVLGRKAYGLAGFHEFVAFHLLETAEDALQGPQAGEVMLQDMESGAQMVLDLGKWREYNRLMRDRLEKNKTQLSKSGMDSLIIRIGEDVREKVNSFFLKRAKLSR